MPFCRTCGSYVFSGEKHKCPPKWEVKIEDYYPEDDCMFVYAADAESAAEKGLEKYDREGSDGPSDNANVRVRVPGEDWKEFKVTSRMEVIYRAEEKDR